MKLARMTRIEDTDREPPRVWLWNGSKSLEKLASASCPNKMLECIIRQKCKTSETEQSHNQKIGMSVDVSRRSGTNSTVTSETTTIQSSTPDASNLTEKKSEGFFLSIIWECG